VHLPCTRMSCVALSFLFFSDRVDDLFKCNLRALDATMTEHTFCFIVESWHVQKARTYCSATAARQDDQTTQVSDRTKKKASTAKCNSRVRFERFFFH
jgi:hypothetical protein